MIGAQAKDGLHVGPLGNLVEPVAVGEAQEGFEIGPDAALEPADRMVVADVEVIHRIDQQVGEDEQCSPVQVGDEEDKEVLVAELGQHAPLPVDEKRTCRRYVRRAISSVCRPSRSRSSDRSLPRR
jgi:hypothetical protein